jgi:hypothetical protein
MDKTKYTCTFYCLISDLHKIEKLLLKHTNIVHKKHKKNALNSYIKNIHLLVLGLVRYARVLDAQFDQKENYHGC